MRINKTIELTHDEVAKIVANYFGMPKNTKMVVKTLYRNVKGHPQDGGDYREARGKKFVLKAE